MEFAESTALLLLNTVLVTALFSALTLPVMKLYARSISLGQLALIAFFAFGRVMPVIVAIYAFWAFMYGGPPSSVPALLLLPVLCFAGWFISRDLARLGVKRGFPGIGARALFGALVLSWVIAGLIYAVHMLL